MPTDYPTPDQQLHSVDGRPVQGRDLLFLQQWFGLNSTEACYLFGITVVKWREYTVKKPDQPLDDPTLALLVWALLNYPEANYLARFPEPTEVYPLFQSLAEKYAATRQERRTLLAQKTFGLALGREATSGNRWFANLTPRATHPQTRRLLFALQAVLQHHGVGGLAAWLERATLEADCRGIDNLWRRGSWRAASKTPPAAPAPESPAEAPRRRGRKSKKADHP